MALGEAAPGGHAGLYWEIQALPTKIRIYSFRIFFSILCAIVPLAQCARFLSQ